MKDLVFITGNQHKADLLAKWLDMPVTHHKLNLDELQSLDLHEVVEHKVRQAYDKLQQPVLVEDVALTFVAMGRLPGTLIKWFLEELGVEGLCKIADGLEHRKAVASICYGLYGGHEIHFFEHQVSGEIAPKPRGDLGFGWNSIFQPEGSDKTYGEMTDDEIRPFSMRAQAIEQLRAFLQQTAL
jgi:inosine triphosphate pyrophosphatase